ncbi:MAG: carbohydrate ABC transporter permease [Christensenellales bacterium]|jgi:putative aldouronate transport system permease protein
MSINRNRIKDSMSWRIFNVANITFMVFLAFIMAYPVWHVLMASLSVSGKLMAHSGVLLLPKGFSTAAYTYVANNPMIPLGYRNTLIVVIIGTTINILMTICSAYFLSRRNQTITKHITIFIMFTMFFSGGMIPSFLNVRELGLYNSLWALMLPGAVSTFNTLILRTAFLSLPESLEESAMIDGANDLTILVRICVPLSTSVLAVLVLYYGVGHWNAWFNAMLYLQDRTLQPLQLVLRQILIQNDVTEMIQQSTDQDLIAETIKYAVIVVATAPILCLYPFLQKYFVRGVLVGAVKG